MTDEENRIADLIRVAFRDVRLGNGVGLMQGQGLDDYENAATQARYRARDEKDDWSKIPAEELNRCHSSLSFFDAEGMRFHLPAFLLADLEGTFRQELVYHLTHFEFLGTVQFSLLSASQQHAVREYMLLCLPNDFDGPIIEKALAEYWTD